MAQNPPAAQEFIEYTGSADLRSITSTDFKKVGVEGQRQVDWSRANNKRLPMSSFTDEAAAVILRDPEFRVVKD